MNKQPGRRAFAWKGVLSAALVLVLLGAAAILPTAPKAPLPPIAPAATATTAAPKDLALIGILQRVQSQQNIDRALLGELNSGSYSLENPFVVVDPYDAVPLSALALFQTAEPMRISIHIPGKTALADVDATFDSYETSHEIPILGLYADTDNTVTMTGTTKSGTEKSVTLHVKTDALPVDLAQSSVIASLPDPSAYQPGFNFLNHAGSKNIANAVDANGDFRWFLDEYMGMVHTFNKGKTIYSILDQYILNLDVLGRIQNVYMLKNGISHDTFQTDHATLLVLGNSEETVIDRLFEIDLKTGAIVHQIDYNDILQRTRMLGHVYSSTDWVHINSVVEYDGDVIVSCRHQSTIMRNSWDGKIKWMLGDPTGYYDMYKPYLLKPIGENFEYPYNQHAVEVLPDMDQNPDTVDILLFDNGSSRNEVNPELMRQVAAHEIVEPKLYSRMVQYRINEKEMTVEQIWQYGADRPELFSYARGDANLLQNGNRIGLFRMESDIGDEKNHRVSIDICETNADARLVWECQIASKKADNIFDGYRVERLPMYWSAVEDFEIGQPVNILVPKEVLDANTK